MRRSMNPSTARDAARHVVELANVNVRDNVLVAPRDGRILYRIANLGECCPPAARCSPCSMRHRSTWTSTCRLPTLACALGGRRADRTRRIPAASHPGVGLLPRVRGPIHTEGSGDQGRSRQADVPGEGTDRLHAPPQLRGAVRIGLPGVAYVRVDSTVAWPLQLRGRVAAKSPS